MKKRGLILLAVILIVIGGIYLALRGRTCVFVREISPGKENAEAYEVQLEGDVVRLTGKEVRDGKLYLTFQAVSRGRAFADIYCDGEEVDVVVLYVHAGGVITEGGFLGRCTGGRIVPAFTLIYLTVLFLSAVRKYRRDVGQSLYRYRNVTDIGLLIFLAFLLVLQIQHFFAYSDMESTLRSVLTSADSFATVALPLAFVLSIIVTASNLKLMKNEGRTWRNMLACILGVVVCLASLFPKILSEMLQRSTVVDVHNEKCLALYVELLVENVIFIIVAYLECILAGTIIMNLMAARRRPAFDKDYMLILGCKVADDGTPTPLLKGRADKALEFAAQQQIAGGKPLIFVPSGGKGPDEPVAEAEALEAYLLSRGIEKERILCENRSKNTEENFRYSLDLIREAGGAADAKIAFATTNYHVFRSGLLAARQGIAAEGVGSRTKGYFSLNAFVREFIATLVSEKKTHGRTLAILVILAVIIILTLYYSRTI